MRYSATRSAKATRQDRVLGVSYPVPHRAPTWGNILLSEVLGFDPKCITVKFHHSVFRAAWLAFVATAIFEHKEPIAICRRPRFVRAVAITPRRWCCTELTKTFFTKSWVPGASTDKKHAIRRARLVECAQVPNDSRHLDGPFVVDTARFVQLPTAPGDNDKTVIRPNRCRENNTRRTKLLRECLPTADHHLRSLDTTLRWSSKPR